MLNARPSLAHSAQLLFSAMDELLAGQQNLVGFVCAAESAAKHAWRGQPGETRHLRRPADEAAAPRFGDPAAGGRAVGSGGIGGCCGTGGGEAKASARQDVCPRCAGVSLSGTWRVYQMLPRPVGHQIAPAHCRCRSSCQSLAAFKPRSTTHGFAYPIWRVQLLQRSPGHNLQVTAGCLPIFSAGRLLSKFSAVLLADMARLTRERSDSAGVNGSTRLLPEGGESGGEVETHLLA